MIKIVFEVMQNYTFIPPLFHPTDKAMSINLGLTPSYL